MNFNKFLFILFSASLVFLFSFCLVMSALAGSASLYLSPSSGTHNVGSTFSVVAKVNSGGVSINAAEGTIKFNPAQVNVVKISKSGSIFTLWTQEPTFSNSKGNIVFGGGSPKAFKGTSGTIITITFRAKTTGSASVNFSSGMVLAADGKGTNILGNMNGGTYTLKAVEETPSQYTSPTQPIQSSPQEKPSAPIVSSPTHSNEEKWYSNNDPKFTWQLPGEVTKISYAIDKKPLTNPKFVADSLVREATFSNLEDGIWYFHINFKNAAGWGDLTHRKVLIDTEPPKPFEIKIDNGEDPTNPTPLLVFNAEDTLSGVERYEILIGSEEPAAAAAAAEKQPYKAPPQPPGEHTVTVTAFDKANNFTSASKKITINPLEPPVITEIPKTLESGESLIIKGTSPYSLATIKIFIQKGTDQPIEKEVKTDQEGKWIYIHDEPAKEGTYKVWAIVIDSRGAQSLPSEKITLTISPRPLSEIFRGPTLVIVILLIIIGVLTSFILYQRREIAKKRKFLGGETEEIEKCVTKTFRALRGEVKEQVSEKETRDKLKEALNISEEFIKKEIEDVEKGLK
jgi:hypothetical protein